MNKFAVLLILFFLTTSTLACAPTPAPDATPTPCPTPEPTASTPHPTADSTPRATSTARVSPPNHTEAFLSSLLLSDGSCHPQKTAEDIGVYIYDLTNDRALVSINADVPFQFASAFKAPAMVYFLSSCRHIWDSSDAAWQDHFHNLEAAENIEYYVSPEYQQLVSEFLADPRNWKNVGDFFSEHRYSLNGAGGDIDQRYFVLEKVYSMIAQSANLATADILQFTFENCVDASQLKIDEPCGEANAINSFNAWFNQFSQIQYPDNTPLRGLYEYGSVLVNGEELTLPTHGQRDLCAVQTATLKCDPFSIAYNVYTPRDLFQFYDALYHLRDERLRDTALSLLQVDEAGPARGNLKNLARTIHAVSFSKNGQAFYNNGSIHTDAGIVRYKGREYIIVTLSFNALDSMIRLYGSFDSKGELVSDPGLIQNLLEETLP
ncbi:MAG: hypothetical protein HY867_10945 [Chloroflexi bacterium]|nr:hypothetical protein [Chloroflexota bacterium]